MILRYISFRILAMAAAAALIAIAAGCGVDRTEVASYIPPEQIDDGIITGTSEEVRIDSGPLMQAAALIRRGDYREIHAILIARDNKLVFETYFEGHEFKYDGDGHRGDLVVWDRSRLHRIMSVTKSITSACIGAAIQQGYIGDVKQPVLDLLPAYKDVPPDGKDKITIENLLTMTSGLEGNEWLVPYSNDRNDVMRIYLSEDPIRTILQRPMVYPPGKYFQYYGGSNFLLAEVIKETTGMDLEAFARKHLFGPLGIEDFRWLRLHKEVVDGAGGLLLRPRDMLKIGLTFLNGGIWHGQRIIPESWVQKSAAPFGENISLNRWDDHWGLKGYGYSWWTHHFVRSSHKTDMYYAAGWGGQYIMVIPALNTVVVFTGGNYTTYRPPFELLKKYILPALR